MNADEQKKTVLCFAGLDSTGGAGLQADIEAIAAQGAHAAPIATALTIQDTRGVTWFESVAAETVIQQARAILEDMPVAAIKIGMLGSEEVSEAIYTLIKKYTNIPVIYDPVLAGGGGGKLSTGNLVDTIQTLILPLCYLLTPNTHELHALAREADTAEAAAMELLSLGCEYVLVTGGHANSDDIQHRLYGNHRCLTSFTSQRLAREFHGSGCTLAASVAALLAQGHEITQAIHRAQDYTLQTLQHAQRLGMGQLIPDRFYWNKQEQ
jgi:hydroxymethylpyrimidine/phosphomethylpyrimidine kinase